MAIDLEREDTREPGTDRSPLDWSISPSSPTTHYTKIDEGMASKNPSDYVYSSVDGNEDEYGNFGGPIFAQEGTDVYVDLYMQGTAYTQTPGIKITLYAGLSVIAQDSWNANTGGAWQVRRHTFTGLSLDGFVIPAMDIRIQHLASGGESLPDPVVR